MSHPPPAHTYCNPVGGPLRMGDPFVFRADGRYVLVGTTDPAEGFRCFTSDDLADWRESGFALRADPYEWGAPPFWAPEVLPYANRYYMTYSARDRVSGRLLPALAVSEDPCGPYRDLRAPWFDPGHGAIDAHLFIDDDGTPYVYYSRNGGADGCSFGMLYGAPLTRDLLRLAAEPVLLAEASQEWELIDAGRNRCNEGPCVLREGALYHLIYSANHTFRPGYGIGHAVAKHPLGPWRKSPSNPIAGTDLSVGYSGAGHACVTVSPDGSERFLVYHTHEDPSHPENERRTVNIDRLQIEGDRLWVVGPTRSPQPLPSGSPA
ncbi:MAG: glycoside hydrolase family 43 protein [Opitutales bacterium]